MLQGDVRKEPKLLDVCTNCCEVFLAGPCLGHLGYMARAWTALGVAGGVFKQRGEIAVQKLHLREAIWREIVSTFQLVDFAEENPCTF